MTSDPNPAEHDESLPVKKGRWASSKDYTLPENLVIELQKVETLDQLLDRYLPPAKSTLAAQEASTSRRNDAVESAFMDALLQEPDARTANNAPAHSTSNDPVVDLFFQLAPNLNNALLFPLLDSSWRKDSLATLRIIWQARSISEGKGVRDEVFYSCMAWIYQKHPRTLFTNLHLLVDQECKRPDLKIPLENGVQELVERPSVSHGYYKDLLNFLLLGVHGLLDKNIDFKATTLAFKNGLDGKSTAAIFSDSQNKRQRLSQKSRNKAFIEIKKRSKTLPQWYQTYYAASESVKHDMTKARLYEKLASDRKFRLAYIVISRLFANKLKTDLPLIDHLASTSHSEKYNISAQLTLAAKWTPSPARSHDKSLFISTAISSIMFPDLKDPIASRINLQTRVLAPLRKALDIPEVKMSAKEWDQVNYERVPSRAMALHKATFFKNDTKRFIRYLEQVASGKKKVSGAALFPHEILVDALMIRGEAAGEKVPPEIRDEYQRAMESLTNSQWDSMVNNLRESSSAALANSIAVVDVSGSMGLISRIGEHSKKNPEPILVSVSLGILCAQLARPPLNQAFITFSADPQINRLQEGGSLSDIAHSMSRAAWGMNTSLHKVFRLLLSIAIKNNLKKEEFIKKVFIFSDMQFDQAMHEAEQDLSIASYRATYGQENKTPHQIIKEDYAKAGYELPTVVYWNIQGQAYTGATLPAQADEMGVEMMSGFSGSLMKVFLGQAEEEAHEAAQKEAELQEEKEEYDDMDEPVDEKSMTGTEKAKITPAQQLAKVLANPAFAKLVVVD